jgi:hypothetical protein
MIAFMSLILHVVVSPLKTKARLEAEIIMLRHQLKVLRRRVPTKPKFAIVDRLLFVWLYRLFPAVLDAVAIVQPETITRWHRTGFRLNWRWKSRSRGGRPKVPMEIRRLIREMSLANRLWGAPRIHGELLKRGIDVAESTVPPSGKPHGGESRQGSRRQDVAFGGGPQHVPCRTKSANLTRGGERAGAVVSYQYDAFFSYKRDPESDEWHRKVRDKLEYWVEFDLHQTPKLFFDTEDIRTGQRWHNKLEEALRTSKCVVCIWSPLYFKSKWCVSEWTTFEQRGQAFGLDLVITALLEPTRA